MKKSRPSGDDRAIILHPLVDLSHACPPFFVDNLKQVFIHGSGKSGAKFHALRDQLIQSLCTVSPPGPFTFVVRCLKALLLVDPPYNEGLSHLLISAVSRLRPSKRFVEDAAVARDIAASLFLDVLVKKLNLETRILVKLPVVFGLHLKDIGGLLTPQQCRDEEKIRAAKTLVEPFILDLIQSRSYTGAVSLLKQFDLKRRDSQDLIFTMASDGQADLAGQWAAHLGRDMLRLLVRRCTEMGQFKTAYRLVECYKLDKDFPEAHHLYRQSSLRKLVMKGLWDVAESIAEEDPRLVDYLLNLALEDGDPTKVTQVCERFQLDHVPLCPELTRNESEGEFMQLESLISLENLHWIDSTDGLSFAVKHLSGVPMVGIDCEWRPDSVKGAGPRKVSILQVASSESVFVFDLISLSKVDQNALKNCIKAVFHAPNILKLGYAVHNDLERLLNSYQELECFQICESVLDLQRVVGKQAKGGLSGLSKAVLGRYIDKRTRFSNWECRPLTKRQLHYAALDAVILLPLFDHLCSVPSLPVPNGLDWKKYLMSFRVTSKFKKQHSDACKKGCEDAGISQNTNILMSSVCASHDDLVSASCELLGLPTPGLLKSQLLNFTQAARLPPPVYTAIRAGPPNAIVYYCTVKVAESTYSGCPAFSKKDAEFWAAHVALTSLDQVATSSDIASACKQDLSPHNQFVRHFKNGGDLSAASGNEEEDSVSFCKSGTLMCKGSSRRVKGNSFYCKSNGGSIFFVETVLTSTSYPRIESKLNITCKHAAVRWSLSCVQQSHRLAGNLTYTLSSCVHMCEK